MLEVTVTSPEKCFFETNATHVVLPGADGSFELRPGHVPLISLLSTGTLTVYPKDQAPMVLYIEAGIVEISKNRVSILLDSAHSARVAEQEKIEAEQRQCRRDLQNQDKVNYHALLKQLAKLAAELQTIDKFRNRSSHH